MEKLKDKAGNDLDWWRPKQVACRWQCSVSTIKRRMKRKEGDPLRICFMKTGGQVRIHISEILRFEEGAKSIPPKQQEVIFKPKIVKSLLAKRRAKIRHARSQGARVA